MKKVYLIGDCHTTRVWEHWNPDTAPVDFKAWGMAGLTAWSFNPEVYSSENKKSEGLENVNLYIDKPQEWWIRDFSEFKDPDIVLIWLGYVDIRQRLVDYNNAKEDAYQMLDRVRSYYKNSVIQIIEPLPQFTEMLLKYDGISPTFTYEDRQNQNNIFCGALKEYTQQHNMLTPITQQEIKDAVGIQEFTIDYATDVIPLDQPWHNKKKDALKKEYWAKIYDLFISKSVDIAVD
jgi:hypothetical protein